MKDRTIISIDQGTTSTRAVAFGVDGRVRQVARRELAQHYPQPGWVEHDAEDIWREVLETLHQVVEADGGVPQAIGITNQRETVVLWDRASGETLHKAIVWQDKRAAAYCAELSSSGHGELVRERTGLVIDPYFSATKLKWLLDTLPDARARADRGELAFGTIDSFLLWRLTGGAVHATDASNAARTMLYDIHRGCWDEDLLKLFDIPPTLLPEVRDNACLFGECDKSVFGHVLPIAAMAGDQQAALVGQACFKPGDVKSTYGTGCFLLLNAGDQPPPPRPGILTTIAYRLGGRTTYALEGSIYAAGAAMGWLKDGLGLIQNVSDSADVAARLDGNNGVYMVPAFVGLGAPHWDARARAGVLGLTFDATGAHVVRAALEAVAYQTLDLAEAMAASGATAARTIRVDGGMAANDWFCQFLADMLETPVERPSNIETTAAGAAFLAGLTVGLWASIDHIAQTWARERLFEPRMEAGQRAVLRAGWIDAVSRCRSIGPNAERPHDLA